MLAENIMKIYKELIMQKEFFLPISTPSWIKNLQVSEDDIITAITQNWKPIDNEFSTALVEI